MDDQETRNYIYLRGVLDSFQRRAVDYYLQGPTPEERFTRLKEIRELVFNKDANNLSHVALSVAPRNAAALDLGIPGEPPSYPDCPDGQVCRGGACVDIELPLEAWPTHGDPG